MGGGKLISGCGWWPIGPCIFGSIREVGWVVANCSLAKLLHKRYKGQK